MTKSAPAPDAGLLERLRAAPRRVVLVGNYGSVNLGDELLLGIVAGWVREAGGEPVAVSVHPEHTRATHGIDAVHYADVGALARAFAEADLMVMGGGGLLQDYDRLDEDALVTFPAFEATQFAQYALLASALDLPYAAIAQGVGPLRGDSARRIARHVFASAIAASLRDEASVSLLREVGCTNGWPVAPDPGWGWRPAPATPLAPASVDARLQDRRVLAMLVRDWPFDPGWEARFVGAFRDALPEGWACLWIDFHRDPSAATQSSPVFARLAAALPGLHVAWSGTSLDEAARLIAGCDGAIGMRLHGALLALASGRPTVTLEYDAKVAALAEEAGLPDAQRVPLEAIGERLPAAIAALCAGGAGAAKSLGEADRERLAAAVLVHRDVLWRAMDGVAPRATASAERFRWLSQWAKGGHASATGFVEALETRLHRQLDRNRMLIGEQGALLGDLARERAEVARLAAEIRHLGGERDEASRALADSRQEAARLHDALAHATSALEAAQREAAQWQGSYRRIEASRSYRATAPLRRLAGAWRELRRTGGGKAR